MFTLMSFKNSFIKWFDLFTFVFFFLIKEVNCIPLLFVLFGVQRKFSVPTNRSELHKVSFLLRFLMLDRTTIGEIYFQILSNMHSPSKQIIQWKHICSTNGNRSPPMISNDKKKLGKSFFFLNPLLMCYKNTNVLSTKKRF